MLSFLNRNKIYPTNSPPDFRPDSPSPRRPSIYNDKNSNIPGLRKLNALNLNIIDTAVLEDNEQTGGNYVKTGLTVPGREKKSIGGMGIRIASMGGLLSNLVPSGFGLPPNFGSHMQLFVTEKSLQRSLVVRKKEIYAQLSLIFGLVLSAFVIYDYIALITFETQTVTSSWLLSLLVLHVAAFYLFLLAFIYSTEAGDIRGLKLSITAGLVNLAAFVSRTAFQLVFVNFEPSVYFVL
ncbi:hypothetical protein BKA69DRAFT_1058932 [Paraphysoderma sedebokerense]|nr:hypothetical protein BKA69DRAFT_1058932 [Paraphysoderma sedebokerense]